MDGDGQYTRFTAPLDAVENHFACSISELADRATGRHPSEGDAGLRGVYDFLQLHADQVRWVHGPAAFIPAADHYRRAADVLYDEEPIQAVDLRPLFRLRVGSAGLSRNLPPGFESTVCLLYAPKAFAIDPFWWAASVRPWLRTTAAEGGELHFDRLPLAEWWRRTIVTLAGMEPAIREGVVSFVPVAAPGEISREQLASLPYGVITEELIREGLFRNTWEDRRSLLLEAETLIAGAHASDQRITPLFHVPALQACVDWLIRNQLKAYRRGSPAPRKRRREARGQLSLPAEQRMPLPVPRTARREEAHLQELCRLELPGVDRVRYTDLVELRHYDSFALFRDDLVDALNEAVGVSTHEARLRVTERMAAARRRLDQQISNNRSLAEMCAPKAVELGLGTAGLLAANPNLGWQDVLPLGIGGVAAVATEHAQKKRRNRRSLPRLNLYMALSFLGSSEPS